MITRLVKLSVKPAKAKEFELLFYQNQPSIIAFDGCFKTGLFLDDSNPGLYFTISHWESEAHLEQYRASNLFNTIWAKVKPLFAAKAEAWTLTDSGRFKDLQ